MLGKQHERYVPVSNSCLVLCHAEHVFVQARKISSRVVSALEPLEMFHSAFFHGLLECPTLAVR
jgi:hypothetical protein